MSCPFIARPVRPAPHPTPLPAKAWLLERIIRGMTSWLTVLHPDDFNKNSGTTKILGQTVALFNDEPTVRQIMAQEAASFPKHHYIQWLLEPLIGNGVFSVNGKEWERLRRLLDQAFRLASLKRVFPQMHASMQQMMQRLRQLEDGSVVDVDALMTSVTGDVIVRTIFSEAMQPEDASKIFHAFSRYQRRAGVIGILRFFHLPESWLLRYAANEAKPIRDWIGSLVRQRLETLGKQEHKREQPQDLLDALIQAYDPETQTSLTEEELVDQAATLFLAGHETSASTLAMALYLLALFPDVQQQARDEVSRVRAVDQGHPGKKGGSISFEDIRSCNYCSAVIQETLRLYPPIMFLMRESTTTRQLSGQYCPAGSMVVISPWVIQRHSLNWGSPHEFQPERFWAEAVSEAEKALASEAYIPFGMGPRKCPGAAFAMQEAVMILASLLMAYELSPVPGFSPDLAGRLTLRSKNGVLIQLKRRPDSDDAASGA